jgi:phosphatidylglycerophosphate synthase
MIKATFGKRVDDAVQTLFPFMFTRRFDPNLLTVTGAVVSCGAAAAFAVGAPISAGILILLGGFFDLVDGVVARHLGISTTFGAFLDSTLDRFVDMVLYLGLVLHFASTGRIDLVALTGVTLIATVLVSYSKARAELFVPVFEGGLLERGERVGVLASGAILGFLVPALWILAAGSLITVVQRFVMAHRAMTALDASRVPTADSKPWVAVEENDERDA